MTAPNLVSARELVSEGYCTPQCLLAIEAGGNERCNCRCGGRGHGLLVDTQVSFDLASATPTPPVFDPRRQFECAGCGKRIPRKKPHYIVRDLRVIVGLCCNDGSTQALHARLWPDCPKKWHDFHDHPTSSATQAATVLLAREWGE